MEKWQVQLKKTRSCLLAVGAGLAYAAAQLMMLGVRIETSRPPEEPFAPIYNGYTW
ncbi:MULTISPECIES: hypothetical protein [unclassified Paenibacillus]|uniref:hypothetical protein n=1 Tax=unclassified Paenibacillus TaxID=185978 RepID=UPI001AEB1410|nr:MULTISPECIES: hypothetical protein [unclassified Paenibacillus]MBP1157522.1 hypothetical protein [Paenibacillus sp. PvP091]MBP1171741.1 hypothetical protein [Paenibacillus sp. PvR098]MBP2438122.1 hypothetical protein [Paenibacillus sp. PvP052]